LLFPFDKLDLAAFLYLSDALARLLDVGP